MERDSKELLAELGERMVQLEEEAPELSAAFVHMDQAAYVDGELERKYKELIGLGIAIYAKCEYCMNIHIKQALDQGATRDEILEAAAVGVAFGGSPAMAHVAMVVMKALDELEE